MWIDDARKVPVFDTIDRARFEADILRGAVRNWPVVALGRQSPEALCDYFKQRASDRKLLLQSAPPEIAGRYSFSDDLKGLNHQQRQLPFAAVSDLILRDRGIIGAPCHYAGGIPVDHVMPAVLSENMNTLVDPSRYRQISLWIGNRTRTAAHWDLPQNMACVVAGRRRFTLFPIEQVGNLYITPLDMTLAGQPTSLVDFHNPDFDKYPRFREAMANAEVADLEPGDVLYMPSLWFHHVESLENFGAMINFWWRDGPGYMNTPLLTLLHGLLTIRDMPLPERMRWRTLFDHYIFQPEGEALAHIPEPARGLFRTMNADIEKELKSYLIQTLSR